MAKENEQKNYTEKVICKKCKHIGYRPLSSSSLYLDPYLKDNEPIYAVIIKKFICPQCGATEFSSSIIEGKVTEKDNIICAAV